VGLKKMSAPLLRLAALSAWLLCVPALAGETPFDLIIAGGHVIDGTAVGMRWVLVNGVPVIADGQMTGAPWLWQEEPLNGRTVAVAQRGTTSLMSGERGVVHTQFLHVQPVTTLAGSVWAMTRGDLRAGLGCMDGTKRLLRI
jgi:hypothetical protein